MFAVLLSVGELHDSLDHVVVGLSEGSDGGVSAAAGVLDDHVDVVGGESLLAEWLGVVHGGTLVLLLSGGGLGGLHVLGEGLSLLLGESLVGVLELELSEDGVGVLVGSALEHLGVVDHEDEAVSLLEGNSGDASELLHAELDEGLSALLLASVELLLLLSYREFNIIVE